MRRAVLHGPRDIRIEDTPMPKPGPGEVLVRVGACSICGSDLQAYSGEEVHAWRSGTGGHEVSGDVAATGEESTDLTIGDRIGVEPYVPCGTCIQCETGYYNRCDSLQEIGPDRRGGFAEYMSVPARCAIKIPESISYEEAALLQPLGVAVHVANRANIRPGYVVGVLGTGPIGLCCIQVAKAYGARRVIAMDIVDSAVTMALKLGADEAINTGRDDAWQRMANETATEAVDVVIETAGGVAATPQQALRIVRKGGRIVIVGVHTKPKELEFRSFIEKEVELVGIWNFGYFHQTREYSIAAELLSKGKVGVKPMITHRFPLDRIREAFETLLNRQKTQAAKVVVVP